MPDAEPAIASRLNAEDRHASAMLRYVWLAFEAVGPVKSNHAANPGRFTLLCASGELAACRAAGSRIAGGATLVVVQDQAGARQWMRDGVCDFLVSSLDEALRILRHEVRKGTPLSVCLLGEPESVLAECIERGVQPDHMDVANPTLLERGAELIAWPSALRPGQQWVMFARKTGSSVAALEAARAWLREALPGGDMRQLWLQNAAAVLGRRLQRYAACPLEATEVGRLLQRSQHEDHSASEGLTLLQEDVQIWPPGH